MRFRQLISFTGLALCLCLAGCSKSQGEQANAGGAGGGGRRGGGGPGGAGAQPVPVSVAAAANQDVPVYLNGLGSVEAFNTVTIKTRVDGPIQEINFKEGQEVKKGQLLAVIDPRQFQVAVSQAEATLYRDQSQLTIAQRNFARYQDLFKQGIVSQQDYDAQESTKGQLEGTVRADQAAIDNAKLQLSYTRITSPINGKVGLRQADIGNVVHAGDANGLAVITQVQPISIVFTIPEDALPSVLQKFHGSLPVEIYSRDNQTKLGMSNLVTINNQIDPTTGTVKLKAVSDNKDGMLWPSQFVNARLLLDVKKNAVVVPAAAVQHGSQGAFAFVVKSDNGVDMRTVQPGIASGNMTVIDQGIAPGEQVVTDGQDKLTPQSKVSVNGSPTGPGGGGGGRRGQGAQGAGGQGAKGQPNQATDVQGGSGQGQSKGQGMSTGPNGQMQTQPPNATPPQGSAPQGSQQNKKRDQQGQQGQQGQRHRRGNQ
jgi:multidrug efflux system membrane fusion protein